jgi:copper(I)-binding protein
MIKRTALSLAVAAGVGFSAWAHHAGETVQAGDLVVSHAWTYANAEMAHATSVYLTMDNRGAEPDRLVRAAVGFADEVVFQAQVMNEAGAVETRDVPAIQINPGQTLTLEPGGIRLVLEGVHEQFEAGENFEIELVFERSGKADLIVEVEEPGHIGDDHDHEEPAS